MSAPDTNVETQKKRHFGPLIGITAGLVFAGILVFAYITSLAQPPGEGQADQVESPSVSVPAEN